VLENYILYPFCDPVRQLLRRMLIALYFFVDSISARNNSFSIHLFIHLKSFCFLLESFNDHLPLKYSRVSNFNMPCFETHSLFILVGGVEQRDGGRGSLHITGRAELYFLHSFHPLPGKLYMHMLAFV